MRSCSGPERGSSSSRSSNEPSASASAAAAGSTRSARIDDGNGQPLSWSGSGDRSSSATRCSRSRTPASNRAASRRWRRRAGPRSLRPRKQARRFPLRFRHCPSRAAAGRSLRRCTERTGGSPRCASPSSDRTIERHTERSNRVPTRSWFEQYEAEFARQQQELSRQEAARFSQPFGHAAAGLALPRVRCSFSSQSSRATSSWSSRTTLAASAQAAMADAWRSRRAPPPGRFANRDAACGRRS